VMPRRRLRKRCLRDRHRSRAGFLTATDARGLRGRSRKASSARRRRTCVRMLFDPTVYRRPDAWSPSHTDPDGRGARSLLGRLRASSTHGGERMAEHTESSASNVTMTGKRGGARSSRKRPRGKTRERFGRRRHLAPMTPPEQQRRRSEQARAGPVRKSNVVVAALSPRSAGSPGSPEGGRAFASTRSRYQKPRVLMSKIGCTGS